VQQDLWRGTLQYADGHHCESEEDYQVWLAEQKTFAQTNGTEEIEVTEVVEPSAEETEGAAEGEEAEDTEGVVEEPAHS
jgi:hypothetical protein